MADEDPRLAPRPLAEVPALVAEGAARYNAGAYWHAHEAWEQAWHALRAARKGGEAEYVQALVFVTAACENLKRGKPVGARRQLRKAVLRLRALAGTGAALGLEEEGAWLRAVEGLERDAQRASGLGDLAAPPPPLRVRAT